MYRLSCSQTLTLGAGSSGGSRDIQGETELCGTEGEGWRDSRLGSAVGPLPGPSADGRSHACVGPSPRTVNVKQLWPHEIGWLCTVSPWDLAQSNPSNCLQLVHSQAASASLPLPWATHWPAGNPPRLVWPTRGPHIFGEAFGDRPLVPAQAAVSLAGCGGLQARGEQRLASP